MGHSPLPRVRTKLQVNRQSHVIKLRIPPWKVDFPEVLAPVGPLLKVCLPSGVMNSNILLRCSNTELQEHGFMFSSRLIYFKRFFLFF